MKYSVVIPTYNHCDDLLKPCIESIFKYTNLKDIELIISANGCSDNTSQYLDELRYKFNQLNLANHFLCLVTYKFVKDWNYLKNQLECLDMKM